MVLMITTTSLVHAQVSASSKFHWHRLPELPAPFGVAGPFVGVSNDTLLVAGGANFPEGVPWHPTATGGISLKQFHREIYTLREAHSGGINPKHLVWATTTVKLPRPIGYGMSVSTDQGVICIGGEWQEYAYAHNSKTPTTTTLFRSNDVYLMTWSPVTQSAQVTRGWQHAGQKYTLPNLPKGTTAACGAIIGDFIYLAGGDCGEGGNNQFLRLNLQPNPDRPWQWESLPSWNGPPRTHALAVEQGGRFFLIGGRNKDAEGLHIHTDAYCFDPQAMKWKKIADVQLPGEAPRSVMAGTVSTIGQDHICVFGGAEAEIILLREQIYPAKIAEAKTQGDIELAKQLQSESDALYDNHQGFSQDILTYCLSTDSWQLAGNMPVSSPVTTTAVKWRNMIVIPSGEERPGVRTQAVWGVTCKE